MNREKRLLVSFLGFFALLVVVGVSVFPLEEDDDVALKISWPLTPALVKKVSYWQILHEGTVYRIEKHKSRWVMTSPFETKIHNEKMANFIRQLGEIEPRKIIEPNEYSDLDVLGLKSPSTRISAFGAQEQQLFQTSLGLVNTFEQTVFVSVARGENEKQIYSLPRLMAFRLGMGLDDLRDKRICARARDEKTEISYERSAYRDHGFKFKFIIDTKARKGRGSPYQLLEPFKGPADERRMRQLLTLIAEEEVKEMVTEDHGDNLKPWRLHRPLYTFELKNAKWERPVFVYLSPILETSGAFYVSRSDARWVGRFVSEKFQHFDLEMNDVIDKRFFSFNLNDIFRWEIWDQRIGHLVLEKKYGEFVMLAPQPALLSSDLVLRAMTGFAFVEGAKLIVEETKEMQFMKTEANNKWLTKMSFYNRRNQKLGQLLFFKSDSRLYGTSSQRKSVFEMAPGALKLLPRSPDGWLTK